MKSNKNNNSKFISGPINVVRLEGNVLNINKVIYIFMDIHETYPRETECSNIRSNNISKYFIENFDKASKSNKIYDFFMEVDASYLTKQYIPIEKREIYIAKLWKLFIQSFDIDREKNIVGKSKEFPNIRFHYLDTRDYTINGYNTNYNINHNVYSVNPHNISHYFLENYDNGLANNITEVKATYDMIYTAGKPLNSNHKPLVPKSIEEFDKYNKEELEKIAGSIYDKLLNKYHHAEIKSKINNIINKELKTLFNDFFEIVHIMYNKVPDYNKIIGKNWNELTYDSNINIYDYGTSIVDRYNILCDMANDNYIRNNNNMSIYVNIMDLYFIRRFLDKDYITNGIAYTGAAHSLNYIYYLVKYFNFNITHYSYLKDDNITEVQDYIKSLDNADSLSGYFYPQKFYQCSDMNSFPPLFQ